MRTVGIYQFWKWFYHRLIVWNFLVRFRGRVEKVNEKIVLHYHLFEGDFGEQGDITLENKIVITRKKHLQACHICMGDIEKGERSRVEKDIFEGELASYRVCQKCCEAISYDYENDCEVEIDKRYKIGYDKRNKARNMKPELLGVTCNYSET